MSQIELEFDIDLGQVTDDLVIPRLVEMAQAQIANMQNRASLGLGADDRVMPRYTPSYERRKRASGRSGLRNLTWSGHLMRSLHLTPIEKQGDQYGIAIRTSDQLATIKAAANQRIAAFFGISPNDADILRHVWTSR